MIKHILLNHLLTTVKLGLTDAGQAKNVFLQAGKACDQKYKGFQETF